MIVGLFGILALGILYGYRIGRLAKRRKWGRKKVAIVAYTPMLVVSVVLLALNITSFILRKDSGVGAWAHFPWAIPWGATVLAGSIAKYTTSLMR